MDNYNADSIQTYAPLEAIRKKLGMYTGHNDNEAVHHAIKEAVSNAVDEFLAGHGTKIELCLDEETNTIVIRDYGRGIPPEKMDDVFTKMHTSGKFEKEGEGAYGASGGINGAGAKILTATGTLKAQVFRNKRVFSNFYRYDFIGKATEEFSTEGNGTLLTWTPDEGVFEGSNTIHYKKLRDLLQSLSYPTPGLLFTLKKNGGKKEEFFTKSIADFLTDSISPKQIISPVMEFKIGNDILYAEGAMVWTKGVFLERSYVNLIPTMDGGTHCTALKTVLTRELNKFLGSDLKGTEIRNGLAFIISVKTLQEPVFKGQSKDSLNMPAMNAPLSQLLKQEMELLFNTNKKFFDDLHATIMQARKKEESTTQIRDVLTKARSKANPIPNKLKPALNPKGAELFVTEGLSASGSLINQRDVYKHAIMSLKGKILNFRKHDMTKVLKNEEIQDLIIAMGGFGDSFTADKCLYDKIIIATDADADGR